MALVTAFVQSGRLWNSTILSNSFQERETLLTMTFSPETSSTALPFPLSVGVKLSNEDIRSTNLIRRSRKATWVCELVETDVGTSPLIASLYALLLSSVCFEDFWKSKLRALIAS